MLRLILIVSALAGRVLEAQSATRLSVLHERATTLIREMANRPLTDGDTLLTWNPNPGGLIHTASVDPFGVRSSLLRGDGVIGTADMRWTNQRLSRFDVQWTSRDSATGGSVLTREIHGIVRGDSLDVTGTASAVVTLPHGPWAVADFGMEEHFIPLLRGLPSGSERQLIAVFRPWHGRWDTVTVGIRDTLGLRAVELRGTSKTRQLMVLKRSGELLWIFRFDQPGERRPLEGTARYQEYLSRRSTLLSLAERYKRANEEPPD